MLLSSFAHTRFVSGAAMHDFTNKGKCPQKNGRKYKSSTVLRLYSNGGEGSESPIVESGVASPALRTAAFTAASEIPNFSFSKPTDGTPILPDAPAIKLCAAAAAEDEEAEAEGTDDDRDDWEAEEGAANPPFSTCKKYWMRFCINPSCCAMFRWKSTISFSTFW